VDPRDSEAHRPTEAFMPFEVGDRTLPRGNYDSRVYLNRTSLSAGGLSRFAKEQTLK